MPRRGSLHTTRPWTLAAPRPLSVGERRRDGSGRTSGKDWKVPVLGGNARAGGVNVSVWPAGRYGLWRALLFARNQKSFCQRSLLNVQRPAVRPYTPSASDATPPGRLGLAAGGRCRHWGGLAAHPRRTLAVRTSTRHKDDPASCVFWGPPRAAKRASRKGLVSVVPPRSRHTAQDATT